MEIYLILVTFFSLNDHTRTCIHVFRGIADISHLMKTGPILITMTIN